MHHLGHDLAARGRHHAQLEVAVVEEDLVPGRDVPRQRVVGGGDPLRRALDRLVGGDGDALALLQLDGSAALEPPGADLRAGEVLEDGDRPPDRGGDLAHVADDLQVLRLIAVGEVEAHDVHAGLDQALEHAALARGGADGGDDLGAAHAEE